MVNESIKPEPDDTDLVREDTGRIALPPKSSQVIIGQVIHVVRQAPQLPLAEEEAEIEEGI